MAINESERPTSEGPRYLGIFTDMTRNLRIFHMARPPMPVISVHGPMGPWAHAPMGKWAVGPFGAHLESYAMECIEAN